MKLKTTSTIFMISTILADVDATKNIDNTGIALIKYVGIAIASSLCLCLLVGAIMECFSPENNCRSFWKNINKRRVHPEIISQDNLPPTLSVTISSV